MDLMQLLRTSELQVLIVSYQVIIDLLRLISMENLRCDLSSFVVILEKAVLNHDLKKCGFL